MGMEIRNLRLIGSSHISPESVLEARKVILESKPEVVALELDQGRFIALLTKSEEKKTLKIIKELGVFGFLFHLVGAWLEKKMGEIVGVKPGAEMLSAAAAAKECNAQIALIDRDIRVTIKRLFKKLTWREKGRFFMDIILAPFSRKRYAFDLRKVPDETFIKNVIAMIKERYPNFYKVLIDERDQHMALRLEFLMQHHQRVVAVVGAGHLEGIRRRLEKDGEKRRDT